MRTELQIRQRLQKIKRLADFAKRHNLAERTLWRIRLGNSGTCHKGTLLSIDMALNAEKEQS